MNGSASCRASRSVSGLSRRRPGDDALAAAVSGSVGAPAHFHRLRRVANLAFASVTLKPSQAAQSDKLEPEAIRSPQSRTGDAL